MAVVETPPKEPRARVEIERLHALVAGLGFGVMVEDEDRRVSLANQPLCAMFGIDAPPEALVGRDCAEAARQLAGLARAPEAFLARIEQVLAGRVAVTGDEILFNDGRVLERDYLPVVVDDVGRGHLWVYRDVTRKRQDADLMRAAAVRDELRLAIDTIPGMVYSARPDGTVDFVNQRWCDYTGLTLEAGREWGWEAAIAPEDRPALRAHWLSLLGAGEPGELEVRVRRFDGALRWCSSRVVPLRDGRGVIVKWYGQVTDIDDRRRAEALLAGENRLLEMLARGTSLAEVLETLCRLVEETAGGCRCGVLLVDATGTRMEHGAGPSLPEGYNQAMHGRALSPEGGACGMAACFNTQVIAADVATDPRWSASPWGVLMRDHGLRSCWSTPIVSRENKVLGTFAIYEDVPGTPTAVQMTLIAQFTHLASLVIERKRSEEALHQAQAELLHVTRVTTLGELAASIAHEINQPLAAIVADATASLNWLGDEHPNLARARESLTEIVSDGVRAGRILTRIRALLARSAAAHAPCDLRTIILGALDLARPALTHQRIVVETSFGADAPSVMGDPVELQQVVLNLLLNAGEAAGGLPPERRRVVVRASVQARDDRSWAVVAVEDAGVGIKEAEVDRLFAAFYTTKPGGLGMGLSIVRSIVDRHGGRIRAAPNAGPGATFYFELPVSA